jgi:hypothetical protein
MEIHPMLLTTLILASSLVLPWQPVVAPAWDLTIEERIALRVDPARRAERWAAYVEIRRQMGSSSNLPSPEDHDVIDGSINPEVYLPNELFDTLLRELPGENGKVLRMTTAAQLEANGFDPETFWRELSAVADRYLEVRREHEALRQQLARTPGVVSHAETDAFAHRRCAARREALAAARAHFGPSRFDRFLYSAIASRLSAIYPVPANGYSAAYVRATLGDCE